MPRTHRHHSQPRLRKQPVSETRCFSVRRQQTHCAATGLSRHSGMSAPVRVSAEACAVSTNRITASDTDGMRRLLLLLLRNLFESEFSRQGRKQTEREEYEKEVEQEIARQREENARKRLQAQKNLQEAQDHSQKSMVDYVREAHELNPDTGPIPQPLPPNSDRSPEVKRGPRGGRYTEDRTKDGRPYRRYF